MLSSSHDASTKFEGTDVAAAYLITGWWVDHVTEEGQEGPTTWSTDIALIYMFQNTDRWVKIPVRTLPPEQGDY